ncbi:carbohydrate-binding module family 18 [Xylariaceae sp. FL0255]|nr:carbohydrate-binding module family 18 [Xylariaceae sp. FL0255]
MWFIQALLLVFCVGKTLAHADAGIPKLAGARRFLSEFSGERLWERRSRVRGLENSDGSQHVKEKESRKELKGRENKSGQCGPGYGSCASGYCCSPEGWCGLGFNYCYSPGCQLNYGSGCDGNQKPSGVDTSTIARPKIGSIPYGGVGIYDCVNPGDIAVTFDDGPYNFTSDLLDKLATYDARATFFITGNNMHKGMINNASLPWTSIIQRAAAEGHQIASHTWSHENYSTLSTAQFKDQMIWNEIAFNDILGYFPTYMRPPYSICPTNTCGAQLATLGYHVVYFDLDTQGYLNDDPTLIQNSKDIWDAAIDGSNTCTDNFLQIEHDTHYQTVYNLTDYVLTSLFNHGYRSVTVGECLGDPPANWYRAGSKAVPTYTFSTRTPTGTGVCGSSTPTGTAVSTDGSCGIGVTCQGSSYGNCCSSYGYCGASIAYCGSGCNPEFGSCTEADSPLPSDSPIPTQTPAPTTTAATFIASTTSDQS